MNPKRLRPIEFLSGKSSKRRIQLLQESIQNEGLRESIDVIEIGGEFYILNGHHRVQALMRCGIDDAPIKMISSKNLPNYGYENKKAVLKAFEKTQRRMETRRP